MTGKAMKRCFFVAGIAMILGLALASVSEVSWSNVSIGLGAGLTLAVLISGKAKRRGHE